MITYNGKETTVYPLIISGKQGSGKSTTAKLVQEMLLAEPGMTGVWPYKMATTLYRMHDAVRDILREQGIDAAEKIGFLLQWLGTDFGRVTYGEDVWVNCALKDYQNVVDRTPTAGPFKEVTAFLIDDVRFKNELEAFSFGLKVRLECPRDVRKARCPAWRENDTHLSEVDLDDSLGLFDLVIDTDMYSPNSVARVIVEAFKDKFLRNTL